MPIDAQEDAAMKAERPKLRLVSFGFRDKTSGVDDNARFASVVMPHLDDAYGLARWLTGNRTDAEDVVQEAFLRAFRAIPWWADLGLWFGLRLAGHSLLPPENPKGA